MKRNSKDHHPVIILVPVLVIERARSDLADMTLIMLKEGR